MIQALLAIILCYATSDGAYSHFNPHTVQGLALQYIYENDRNYMHEIYVPELGTKAFNNFSLLKYLRHIGSYHLKTLSTFDILDLNISIYDEIFETAKYDDTILLELPMLIERIVQLGMDKVLNTRHIYTIIYLSLTFNSAANIIYHNDWLQLGLELRLANEPNSRLVGHDSFCAHVMTRNARLHKLLLARLDDLWHNPINIKDCMHLPSSIRRMSLLEHEKLYFLKVAMKQGPFKGVYSLYKQHEFLDIEAKYYEYQIITLKEGILTAENRLKNFQGDTELLNKVKLDILITRKAEFMLFQSHLLKQHGMKYPTIIEDALSSCNIIAGEIETRALKNINIDGLPQLNDAWLIATKSKATDCINNKEYAINSEIMEIVSKMSMKERLKEIHQYFNTGSLINIESYNANIFFSNIVKGVQNRGIHNVKFATSLCQVIDTELKSEIKRKYILLDYARRELLRVSDTRQCSNLKTEQDLASRLDCLSLNMEDAIFINRSIPCSNHVKTLENSLKLLESIYEYNTNLINECIGFKKEAEKYPYGIKDKTRAFKCIRRKLNTLYVVFETSADLQKYQRGAYCIKLNATHKCIKILKQIVNECLILSQLIEFWMYSEMRKCASMRMHIGRLNAFIKRNYDVLKAAPYIRFKEGASENFDIFSAYAYCKDKLMFSRKTLFGYKAYHRYLQMQRIKNFNRIHIDEKDVAYLRTYFDIEKYWDEETHYSLSYGNIILGIEQFKAFIEGWQKIYVCFNEYIKVIQLNTKKHKLLGKESGLQLLDGIQEKILKLAPVDEETMIAIQCDKKHVDMCFKIFRENNVTGHDIYLAVKFFHKLSINS